MPEQNTLSERETEILQLVATGLTNREIAQKLTISPNTVKVHLSNIFEKINVSSRTEATMYGIEHGIVDVPGVENGETVLTWQDLVRKNISIILPLLLIVFAVIAALWRTVLFLPTSSTSFSFSDVPNLWKVLTPMPEARANMATVVYDGNIYAVGGEGPEGVSSTVFCYLTTEDRWERLSDKPTPVADVKGALIGEKVYIPGGRLADGSQTDILEIYDPRQNTWETGKPLPKPISAYAMIDFEGKLYLFGGWDGEKAQSGVFIYDPEENVWEEGTQMPTRRYLASAANINEKIYVVGGRNSNGSLDNLELYYPQRDLDGDLAWDSQLLVPESIKNLTVKEISGYLYIIGQNDSSDIQIFNFDKQNNEWILINTKINKINTETFGIVSMDGKLIFLGGMDNQKILSNNVESYRVLFTIAIPIINQ